MVFRLPNVVKHYFAKLMTARNLFSTCAGLCWGLPSSSFMDFFFSEWPMLSTVYTGITLLLSGYTYKGLSSFP